jgi:hypothetical protein
MYNTNKFWGDYMADIKFGKRFVAGLLAVSIIGGATWGGFHLYKRSEIGRIKGYLEDFLTEDNYVDLSKVSKAYDIRNFNGEYLDDAMEELGVKYVRLTDTYVYDGKHVTPFETMSAVNKDKVIYVDQDGNEYYDMYEPIRVPSEDGVEYVYPEGYELIETDVIAEPYRYYRLEDTEVVVRENNYEDSYSISLEKKR